MGGETLNTAQHSGNEPLYPDVGVMAFVPDVWGEDVWQVRHQVLTRLSRYFHVLWVDPALGWRKALRDAPPRPDFRIPMPDQYPLFETYRHSKWSAKFFRPALLADSMRNRRVALGIDRLRQRGCKRIVAYLWRPNYLDEISSGAFDGYCYHIDDEYTFSTVDLPTDEQERRVIEGANHVFIHSPGMMEKKGGLNPRTTYVPNGVDVALYSRDFSKPVELEDIAGPIVMYIGVLKSMLDWDLLQALSVKLPQVTFVFVGPMGTVDETDCATMASMSDRENVRFTGSREIYELPAYAAHASICIMPYRSNGYTKYIFPIKVNEYLAAGKPTIGTSIRTLQDYRDVIALADDVDEWTGAIQAALEDSPAELNVARRVDYARRFNWDEIVRLIADRIDGEHGG